MSGDKIGPRVSRRVEVKSEGAWYKARVIDVRSGSSEFIIMAGRIRTNEWVTAGQLRTRNVVHYPTGLTVEVRWKGKLVRGKSIEERRRRAPDPLHRLR